MQTPPGLAPGMTGVGPAGLKENAVQGVSELTPGKHSRLASKQTLVPIIIGLLFSFHRTILAVKRPPYPIKPEVPHAGHWIIISTT
jgi:hypothetical protein